MKKFFKRGALLLLFVIVTFWIYELSITPPTTGDWQTHLATPSTAEFNGDMVTIKNVRNYRYYPTEKDIHPAYYDKTYDMSKIKKVWYTAEPFNENKQAAHTYVSFEFENGDFFAITIEARKTKDQVYSIWKGFLRTYPLVYIVADERDVTLLRANLRKDKVYVYPVKLSDPKNAKILLENMLTEMNTLLVKPRWYNTVWSNCTSEIAKQVDKVSSGRVPLLTWKLVLTASADELALDHGLLDTNLSIDDARAKYQINEKSEKAGDIPNYSKLIRAED